MGVIRCTINVCFSYFRCQAVIVHLTSKCIESGVDNLLWIKENKLFNSVSLQLACLLRGKVQKRGLMFTTNLSELKSILAAEQRRTMQAFTGGTDAKHHS